MAQYVLTVWGWMLHQGCMALKYGLNHAVAAPGAFAPFTILDDARAMPCYCFVWLMWQDQPLCSLIGLSVALLPFSPIASTQCYQYEPHCP